VATSASGASISFAVPIPSPPGIIVDATFGPPV
jgi:hypothetical protein